jgi:uncharacterized protein (DUF1778 family)
MATTEKRPQNATTIRFDDEYTRQVIDKAAALLHQTRTGFLLSVARERAEAVIKEQTQTRQEIEMLILSPAASLDMVRNLEDPPRPNKALKNAMKSYHHHNKAHRK